MTTSVPRPARPSVRAALAAVLAAGSVALACGGDSDSGTAGSDATDPTTESTSASVAEPVIDPGDGGDYAPEIDPADFVAGVDNPYFPLPPGASWSYEGTDEDETERIDVTVTDERREVMGIPATVVRDTVRDADGNLVEDTRDWYAQDRGGNVWYLGEETAEYEDGEIVSREGSWEAGVDGALPGIIMQAAPAPGEAYRQEFYAGEAEDVAEVARTGETASVAAGDYDRVVVIREWNPLEPEVVEEKSYAPGVGVVLEDKVEGGEGRVELVSYDPGG